jgi:hypothetical protein
MQWNGRRTHHFVTDASDVDDSYGGVAAKMMAELCNKLLLSGKTLALKQIRADTSHEVSALLVIFVLQNTINNHGQR